MWSLVQSEAAINCSSQCLPPDFFNWVIGKRRAHLRSEEIDFKFLFILLVLWFLEKPFLFFLLSI